MHFVQNMSWVYENIGIWATSVLWENNIKGFFLSTLNYIPNEKCLPRPEYSYSAYRMNYYYFSTCYYTPCNTYGFEYSTVNMNW